MNVETGVLLTLAVTVSIGYGRWLQRQDTIGDIRPVIREELEGKEFSNKFETQRLVQVDKVIPRETGLVYKLKQFIPYLREKDGEVILTVRATRYAGREEIWIDKLEDDIVFSEYLKEKTTGDYPEVEFVDWERVAINAKTQVRIRIETLDMNEIIDVVEQVPAFQEYYTENYPLDSRYRTPQ